VRPERTGHPSGTARSVLPTNEIKRPPNVNSVAIFLLEYPRIPTPRLCRQVHHKAKRQRNLGRYVVHGVIPGSRTNPNSEVRAAFRLPRKLRTWKHVSVPPSVAFVVERSSDPNPSHGSSLSCRTLCKSSLHRFRFVRPPHNYVSTDCPRTGNACTVSLLLPLGRRCSVWILLFLLPSLQYDKGPACQWRIDSVVALADFSRRSCTATAQ
jgi:hypothetical protein